MPFPHLWIHKMRKQAPCMAPPPGPFGILRNTPNCSLLENKNAISHLGVGSLPHYLSPTPGGWNVTRGGIPQHAGRRGLLRSSSVAALKGGRCGGDLGDCGSWGTGRGRRDAVGVGREPREPVRLPIAPDGGGPEPPAPGFLLRPSTFVSPPSCKLSACWGLRSAGQVCNALGSACEPEGVWSVVQL